MSDAEIERRIMSERRPQPMPPTPSNPVLDATQRRMYTGETADEFYARRKPFEELWNSLLAQSRRGEFPA